MDIRHLISDHLLCPGDIVGEFFLLQFLGELPEGVSDVLGAGTEPLQRLGKKNEGYREDFYQSRVVLLFESVNFPWLRIRLILMFASLKFRHEKIISKYSKCMFTDIIDNIFCDETSISQGKATHSDNKYVFVAVLVITDNQNTQLLHHLN